MQRDSIEELHEKLKNCLTAQEYMELLEKMIKTVVKMGVCIDATTD